MYLIKHHHAPPRGKHSLWLERLELRTLLSVAPGPQPAPFEFQPGEMIIGFEGDVAAAFASYGADPALALAERTVCAAGLHSGRVLYALPAQVDQAARVATLWQLPETIDVKATTRQVAQLPGVAYAEPNFLFKSQSIPGDASFVGTWEFGVQEHLTQIGAPAAWDVTTGDASVVVAVIDTGVDLDHPDLNDNLLPGTTFVEGTTTPQDDNGHGTQIAGLIAAEMDNLSELAGEAEGDAAWAGGIVGVAPGVSILPVKVLNADGQGRVTDIAAGIFYAVDPDGDPNTADGADIIPLAIGGSTAVSQVIADAIAFAHDRDVLVIAAAGHKIYTDLPYSAASYPASDPHTLAVTTVDASDQWDGTQRVGTSTPASLIGHLADLSAPGVNVLATFVDRHDIAETATYAGGAYGRDSGTSMATAIVAGAAAFVKSAHPNWGADEIAGQLLATAYSIDSLNPGLQGMLGAGRVNVAAAVGPAMPPRVISIIGLGDTGIDNPLMEVLEVGDTIDVRFSHAMEATGALAVQNYELVYLGDPEDPADDQRVDLSMATPAPDPAVNYVLDDENYYNAFPGRGVRLRVEGIDEHYLPAGMYRFTIAGVPSTGGAILQELTHEFEIRLHKLPPFAEPHAIVQGNDVWESQRDQTRDVVTADLDGDDDEDVLKISSNQIAWFENVTGTAEFGPPRIIASRETAGHKSLPTSVTAADVDNDGDLDVLSIERYGRLTWYENQDGLGRFGPRRTIGFLEPSPYGAPPALLAADLDSDGDTDVLINDRWFENIDGLGTFRQIQLLNVDAYRTIPADLDNDGDLDLVSVENDQSLAWYENTDGFANFESVRPIGDGIDAEYVAAADLDDDGDLDLVTRQGLFGPLVWFENTDARGTFGRPQTISNDVEKFTSRIFTGDVDGDQDLDVLIGNAWYENTDGAGKFAPTRLRIDGNDTTYDQEDVMSTADLDGDGDLDVVKRYAWYENTNGQADFGPPSVIGRLATDFKSTADLDQDGDLDLLFGSSHYVVWQPNLDGLGAFGDEQIIGEGFTELVQALDIDGDGDLDIVSAETNIYDDQQRTYRSELVWREHLDGPVKRAGRNRYEAIRDETLLLYDFDSGFVQHNVFTGSDGEPDLGFGADEVLSASGDSGGPIFMHGTIASVTASDERVPQTDSNSVLDSSWGELGRDTRVSAFRAFIADVTGGEAVILDLLGDFDFNGVLDATDVDALADHLRAGQLVALYDLDNSGVLDPDDHRAWVKNLRGTWYGDADLDGLFDATDLNNVLAAGAYETNVPAVWSSGDFNGDGHTDSGDLIIALADGGYEVGPYAAVNAVPEPASLVVLAAGLMSIATLRRHVAR